MPWLRRLRPVILLVFANERGIDSAYLRKLDDEMDEIMDSLSFAEQAGRCRVVVVHNATHSRFCKALTDHRRHIIGVHFAGHADPGGLRFDDGDGGTALAVMEGVAALLGSLRRLRWIFLNGCGTAEHVGLLHSRLSAPIIATECAIRDTLAQRFADQFYYAFARSQTLEEAYDTASAGLRSTVKTVAEAVRGEAPADQFFEPGPDYRFLRPQKPSTVWPWVMHVSPEAPDAARWRLPVDTLSPLIRPLALGAMALLCLLVALRVAVDLYRIWGEGGPSAAASADAGSDTGPGSAAMPRDAMPSDIRPPDAMPSDAMPPDTIPPDTMSSDAIPSDAMPPDAIPPDAMPPDVSPRPPTPPLDTRAAARARAAREAAAREAAARKAAARKAAARKAAIDDLSRQFEGRLTACDCGAAKAKADALRSTYGVDKGSRYQTWCARQPSGQCARDLSARVTEDLSTCRCDMARSKVQRLRDDYGVDRNSEWARRCAIPNLPGSCL